MCVCSHVLKFTLRQARTRSNKSHRQACKNFLIMQLMLLWKLYRFLLKAKITDNLAHCTLLDLSKAFNSVDHNILTHKNHLNGMRGVPLNKRKSYLSNRNHYSNNCLATASLCSISRFSFGSPAFLNLNQ